MSSLDSMFLMEHRVVNRSFKDKEIKRIFNRQKQDQWMNVVCHMLNKLNNVNFSLIRD